MSFLFDFKTLNGANFAVTAAGPEADSPFNGKRGQPRGGKPIIPFRQLAASSQKKKEKEKEKKRGGGRRRWW